MQLAHNVWFIRLEVGIEPSILWYPNHAGLRDYCSTPEPQQKAYMPRETHGGTFWFFTFHGVCSFYTPGSTGPEVPSSLIKYFNKA